MNYMADTTLLSEFVSRLEQIRRLWVLRVPELAGDYKEVQEVYAKSPDAFSIAGEIRKSVLESAKLSFEDALLKGMSQSDWTSEARETWAKKAIISAEKNLDARLGTIYRTNMATAMARGRIEKGRKYGVVGFMRSATHDGDARDNHVRADGLHYSINSPDIDWFSLPWGYNCRCTDIPLSYMAAREKGLLNENGDYVGMTREQWIRIGAFPDDAFERTRSVA